MAKAHRHDGTDPDGGEDVAWVRRVNARWIVHGGLDESAGAYMNRLGGTDPRRLALSCRIARALAGQAHPGEDPKPWFYAGLFSLANPAEVAEFLLGHRLFTTICVGSTSGADPAHRWPDFNPATLDTVRRIRAAIARLSTTHPGPEARGGPVTPPADDSPGGPRDATSRPLARPHHERAPDS